MVAGREQGDGAALLLARVIGSGQEADAGVLLDDALADLNMLVTQAGQERTVEEFRALLEPSGFALRRVIPTGSIFAIVEAEAV